MQNSLLGYKTSETARKRMRNSRIAYLKTPRNREKIARALRIAFQNPELRRKLSEQISGPKHWNWQGGISRHSYALDWTETLKRSIRERDNYICQVCSRYGYIVHHIDYDKKNSSSENLIVVCPSCHIKTNYNRKHWIHYFKVKRSVL